jgi:hypothetical protein
MGMLPPHVFWQQVLRLYGPYGGSKYFNSIAAHGFQLFLNRLPGGYTSSFETGLFYCKLNYKNHLAGADFVLSLKIVV